MMQLDFHDHNILYSNVIRHRACENPLMYWERQLICTHLSLKVLLIEHLSLWPRLQQCLPVLIQQLYLLLNLKRNNNHNRI